MMDWGHNTNWWNGGMLFMGLFWLVLIAIAVWAVIRMTHRGDQTLGNSLESARRILDRRLAGGEIDAQTYAATRRLLEGHSADHDVDQGAARSVELSKRSS